VYKLVKKINFAGKKKQKMKQGGKEARGRREEGREGKLRKKNVAYLCRIGSLGTMYRYKLYRFCTGPLHIHM
jgi:hypothetical protein